MSDVVQRLAEKWDEWVSTNPGSPPQDLPEVDARWWLKEIAEELDRSGSWWDEQRGAYVSVWLREQAREDE